MAEVTDADIAGFIKRWERSGAAERANYQLFLSELCDIIGVPRPEPATPDNAENAYVFERPITFQHGDGATSTGFIDLYKRSCYILEAKQGASTPVTTVALSSEMQDRQRALRKGFARRGSSPWDDALLRAKGQAEQYVRALPAGEGRPPFVIVVDVGHSLELYSEFSCTGGMYIPFPSPGAHRIFIKDLDREAIRERLRQVWTNPMDLDPTRRGARATRDIAERLARLAVSLERAGNDPAGVAAFLMRCLFTMFSEDVGLLDRGSFTRLLDSLRDTPQHFAPMVEELWQHMDRGGFSTSLRTNILQFNGGLFENATALPLNKDQLLLLIEASRSDWRDVEPSIFGTLLERALSPQERHKLGAHYTPRPYVERLVLQTVVKPIREQWETTRTAAVALASQDDLKQATALVKKFHRDLCNTRVLDPACGTGNFLYVTLEHLKRIEGEMFDFLDGLGERQIVLEMAGETVDPHQFLGLEINPRAAAIAELVLWIGTLQWHFRNRGNVRPPQPTIRNFKNIECRDALIAYDRAEPLLDAEGRPVTRWDGITVKKHPVTGRDVPDESVRVPVMQYVNPRPATWPNADYVVGNPPFIGPAIMRQALGDGYTETIRAVHSDLGESSDFVMYWWNHAARLARSGKIKRFGFVTTNSLRQKFNRRVLETHLSPGLDEQSLPAIQPLSLLFAIPDHPWVDTAEGAAVRIAMTVGAGGVHPGLLQTITAEQESGGEGYDVELSSQTGKIQIDLTIGANVAGGVPLLANGDLSNRGVCLFGDGFIVTRDEAKALGLGTQRGAERCIREYRNGRDITGKRRDMLVIDLFGLSSDEVCSRFPAIYQWVLERVKPTRDGNNRAGRRDKWWLFGETNPKLRQMLFGLSRYIATVETSKHRFFVFLDKGILPDNMLVNIASDDPFHLGVLNSRIHVCWALAAGGTLEDRPRYNKSRCFETFPFPAASEKQKARIRELAEQLDENRKSRQVQHADLTMTDMYNVLEKLRTGESLSAKDKVINEQGLVSVLKQLHDDLDAAVFDAYGWSAKLDDNAILEGLVALNVQRAKEEAKGVIRWLRPDFQCRTGTATQTELGVDSISAEKSDGRKQGRQVTKRVWPRAMPEQVRVLHECLVEVARPVTASELAKLFLRAPVGRVDEVLQALVAVGKARSVGNGRYMVG